MKLNRQQLVKILSNRRVQLLLVVLIGFWLRLYKINNPILDWHSFRQADTASVTHRYREEGIDLLQPKYHDLSNIQSGMENPEGYRMVEFPIINGILALVLRWLPQADLVITSRFASVLASVGTLIFFYWFLKSLLTHRLAIVSTTLLSILPFSVYYSRVVLPEPFVLLFATGSLAFFLAHLKKKKMIYWWSSLLMLALAFLLKPFVLFQAPLYLCLLYHYQPKFYKKIKTYLFAMLAITPLLLWRYWIRNYPEGIPASDWLFNQDGIRLRPAWFRWLFWERFSVLIGGFVAPVLVILNFTKSDKALRILISWWSGLLAYLVVFATGNVRHDYYQVLLLPCLALTFSRGLLLGRDLLVTALKKREIKYAAQVSSLTAVLIVMVMIFFGWQRVKGFYNVNNWEYLHTGEEVDQILPKDAKVIAPAMGDTMFLFQTRRSGWPIGFNISEKIEAGATHYVSTSYDDEARELEEKYLTIKKTSEFILIDLTTKKPENEVNGNQ